MNATKGSARTPPGIRKNAVHVPNGSSPLVYIPIPADSRAADPIQRRKGVHWSLLFILLSYLVSAVLAITSSSGVSLI